MKKIFLMLTACAALVFASCQSNEDKASALIAAQAEEMFSVPASELNVLNTIVDVAKQTVYNDTTCWQAAADYNTLAKKNQEFNEEALNLEAELKSLAADKRAAKKNAATIAEKEAALQKARNNREAIQGLMNALLQLIDQTQKGFNPEAVIGWDVTQKIAFKADGQDCEANVRFVIDTDFKHIYLFEDLEDDHDKAARLTLDAFLRNDFAKAQSGLVVE